MIVAELGSRCSFIRADLHRQGPAAAKKNTCDIQDARLEAEIPDFCLESPARERSWMMPVGSSIVIINLIAKLPLLYHKPQQPALT
jgi:hypothetical protein